MASAPDQALQLEHVGTPWLPGYYNPTLLRSFPSNTG